MTKIRTRYAPSPTGRMHVGNLRTALYAYLIAKHEGGDFLLRIEDTDRKREVEGGVQMIIDAFKSFGLPFDEGTATIRNTGGRVDGMPGNYVVGWIKRGPSGGIGANRICAQETVGNLLADAVAGELPKPKRSAKAFTRLAARRARKR